MRIGLYAGLSRSTPLDALLEQIAKAERDGFASIWLANIFGYDALVTLALAGRSTTRIELGTAVVPTYPRHPIALAQQALTVQAASHNRLALGIGLSHRVVIENMLGLDYSKPLRHTREYLTALRGLLSGQPTDYTGQEYRVKAQLSVPGAQPPPILVAALGEQMLALAGTLADGTITWMGGVKYLAENCVPAITRAATAAGRPAPRIVAGLPVAVTSSAEVARQSTSKVYATYAQLPSYRAVLDKAGARDAADVALIGDEDEVARQIEDLAAAGVTDFNASVLDVREDPPARERTYQVLAELARARNR